MYMVRMPFEKKNLSPHIDIAKLIDKGAPVKEDVIEDSQKWVNINLRIPKEMLNEIDSAVEECIGITRTGWILQTLQKELKRIRKEAKEDL